MLGVELFTSEPNKRYVVQGEIQTESFESILECNEILIERATNLKADGVINISYSRAWGKVSATGTAVKFQTDDKQCPDCAELIKREARKCRFCGLEFSDADITKASQFSGDIKNPILSKTRLEATNRPSFVFEIQFGPLELIEVENLPIDGAGSEVKVEKREGKQFAVKTKKETKFARILVDIQNLSGVNLDLDQLFLVNPIGVFRNKNGKEEFLENLDILGSEINCISGILSPQSRRSGYLFYEVPDSVTSSLMLRFMTWDDDAEENVMFKIPIQSDQIWFRVNLVS